MNYRILIFLSALMITVSSNARVRQQQQIEHPSIVVETKTIEIPGIANPYNASLINRSDHYLLFFRYDTEHPGLRTAEGLPPYYTNIGVVVLDYDFSVISEPKTLATGSRYSEDARAFTMNDELYIAYNDADEKNPAQRIMKLSKLDREGTQIIETYNLDIGLEPMEKNWPPFLTEDGLYFMYQINPQIVLKFDEIEKDLLRFHFVKDHKATDALPWDKKQGTLRGGTPAILVDGEYIAFFHNFIDGKDNNNFIFYSMGAYRFEATPPFRITSMSKEPISFDGIFDSKRGPRGVGKNFLCLYPAGLAVGSKNGRAVFYVSCGENDSAVKILTIDKEKLYASMVPVR